MTRDALTFDVIVIGAGHNGLVSAALLSRAGLRVKVVEAQPRLGGAVRTERPFALAPGLATSTGAYLLGLMPPELIRELGLSIPLLRRDPHYFLPTTGKAHLLLGSDQARTREQLSSFFSARDIAAHDALAREIADIRDDVAPTWLEEPESIEATAERHVRPSLRSVFVDLCRRPIRDYLGRFGFESELLQAMYAVTDGFSGLSATWDMPGTGMNFLVHNMCRLPGSDGTWMIVQGGMGVVTEELARVARAHGADIEASAPASRIVSRDGVFEAVQLEDGRELRARAVVVGADPFRMRDLIGRSALPDDYNARLDGYVRPGMTLKVNLALSALPRFTCLPDAIGQHRTTIHLLPEEDVLGELVRAFRTAKDGRLPERPTIEWYIHTAVDPSLQDDQGRHSSALFVQWVPNEIAGSTWEAEEHRYVDHLLSICDRFAPGASGLVVDRFTLHPKRIEQYFGMTYGHIHHVDNSFGFDERLPVRTPISGVFSASAACHPAGSVIGAAGYIAARCVMREMGVAV